MTGHGDTCLQLCVEPGLHGAHCDGVGAELQVPAPLHNGIHSRTLWQAVLYRQHLTLFVCGVLRAAFRKEEKKRYEEAVAAAREAGEERVRQLEEDWRREKEGLRKAHEKQVGARMLVPGCPQRELPGHLAGNDCVCTTAALLAPMQSTAKTSSTLRSPV